MLPAVYISPGQIYILLKTFRYINCNARSIGHRPFQSWWWVGNGNDRLREGNLPRLAGKNVLTLEFEPCVRCKISNTRCLFGWFFFNLFSSQVVTTGTNSYLMRKERVTVYRGDTADDTTKLSTFLYRHRSISASESCKITCDSSCLLGMRLRVICTVTK